MTGKENVNHGRVEEGTKKRKHGDISLQDMHVVMRTIEDLKNQVTELKKKVSTVWAVCEMCV